MLLAGASVVQIASVLYAKGLMRIQEILEGLEKMDGRKTFFLNCRF